MKSRQTEIQITMSQREGVELRNQIITALGGDTMPLYDDKMRGTAIANLFDLLSANFENSVKGVNQP